MLKLLIDLRQGFSGTQAVYPPSTVLRQNFVVSN